MYHCCQYAMFRACFYHRHKSYICLYHCVTYAGFDKVMFCFSSIFENMTLILIDLIFLVSFLILSLYYSYYKKIIQSRFFFKFMFNYINIVYHFEINVLTRRPYICNISIIMYNYFDTRFILS